MARTKKTEFKMPNLDLDKLAKLKFSRADLDPDRLGRYIKQNPKDIVALAALIGVSGAVVYEREKIVPLLSENIPAAVVKAVQEAGAAVGGASSAVINASGLSTLPAVASAVINAIGLATKPKYDTSTLVGLSHSLGSPSAIYQWICSHIGYEFYYNGKYSPQYMFSTHRKGNCYDQSRLFATMAGYLGYRTWYGCGYTCSGYGHCHARILINGRWYEEDSVCRGQSQIH